MAQPDAQGQQAEGDVLEQIGADLAPLAGDVAPLEERLRRSHRRDSNGGRPTRVGPRRPGSDETDRLTWTTVITLERVSKSYGDGNRGGGRPEPRDRRRRARRAGRPVGMRQDHHLADDQPAHRADLGTHPHRRRERAHQGPGRHAPGHRLRHPTGRPLPPSPRLRQRGRRAPPAGLGLAPGSSAASTSCSSSSASIPRATAGASPTSCPGASANGWAWPGPSAPTPPCSSWTSPSRRWTPSPASACRTSSSICRRSSRSRSSSSPTTSRRRPSSATASPCSPRGASSSSTTRPAEILGRPETPFVADFVGADRGVRRLAVVQDRGRGPGRLRRWCLPPLAMDEARALAADAAAKTAVVVDDDGRLLGWVSLEPGADGTVGAHTEKFAATGAPRRTPCAPRWARCSSTTCAGSPSSTTTTAISACSPPTASTPPCGARWAAPPSSPEPNVP